MRNLASFAFACGICLGALAVLNVVILAVIAEAYLQPPRHHPAEPSTHTQHQHGEHAPPVQVHQTRLKQQKPANQPAHNRTNHHPNLKTAQKNTSST